MGHNIFFGISSAEHIVGYVFAILLKDFMRPCCLIASGPGGVLADPHSFSASGLHALLLVSALLSTTALTLADSMPRLDAVYVTKSVFIDDLNFGRDPFFPETSRRRLVPILAPVPLKPAAPEVPDNLFILKGISTYKEERWALINRYTFAPGEEIDVKVDGRTLRVRCVEVRERSVIINVRGTGRELFLRPNL